MIRLILWLIIGHVHKWQTVSTADLFKGNMYTGATLPTTGKVYILRCEHCGNVKRQVMK